MPAAVKVANGIFTDAKGMTLYTFDNDKEANKSACAGNCLNNWPVLKAEAADKDMGDWKVITRDDGSKQWAYKGKPLYYFAMDKARGRQGRRRPRNGVASGKAITRASNVFAISRRRCTVRSITSITLGISLLMFGAWGARSPDRAQPRRPTSDTCSTASTARR